MSFQTPAPPAELGIIRHQCPIGDEDCGSKNSSGQRVWCSHCDPDDRRRWNVQATRSLPTYRI